MTDPVHRLSAFYKHCPKCGLGDKPLFVAEEGDCVEVQCPSCKYRFMISKEKK